MEMLAEAESLMDGQILETDGTVADHRELVRVATRVRRSLEGMWDMLNLYNWLDEPSVST